MKKKKKPKVELRPAWEWTCEECGRDNFARAVVTPMTAEECDEAGGDFGLDPGECVHGDWISMPRRVTCGHCRAEHKVDQSVR